jgi:hypothetical protein
VHTVPNADNPSIVPSLENMLLQICHGENDCILPDVSESDLIPYPVIDALVADPLCVVLGVSDPPVVRCNMIQPPQQKPKDTLLLSRED